jgi:hypothetical protein
VIHPRDVARLLTLREWLCLGEQVDATFGKGRRIRFNVLKIERGDGKLNVTVDVEGAQVRRAEYALKAAA